VKGEPTNPPDVLARWSHLPVPADSPAQSTATRARVVDVVVRTMLSSKSRTSVRRRWAMRMGLGAAAAAVLIAAVALGRSRWPSPSFLARLHAKPAASVVLGREFAAPAESSSAAGVSSSSQIATDHVTSSRLQLVSGVEVVVGPETRLALPSEKDTQLLREELVLESGILQVRVPKLPKGALFSIRTPNAVVSVHGTAFSVEVTKSGASEVPQTRVIVTEGVVSVQHAGHELLLDAGSEWTSAVANPPVATHDVPSASKPGPFKPASPTHEDRRAASPERPSPEHKAGNVRGASGVDPTELANQNRLFAEAMSARDRGDGAHAVALLEDFVRKYPVCPLTEDAYVARFRVLSRMGDRAGAAKAARGYLALYPDGLAGQEARALSFAAGPGLE
jgi:hypothetical protein